MKRPKPPLFLERDSYRRRRVADAARVLPVLGALLFLVPLLWAPGETHAPDTAPGGLYVFLVWGGLILAAFLLSRRLGPEPPTQSLGDDEGGG
jgi:peptidoglycan/LPS O-acetylase OafA/YrhL